jgi:hypothetical protein
VASVAVASKLSRATTTTARPQQEEAVVATSHVLVPRDPPQGHGRARSGSRSVGGRETAEAPTGGDSAPTRGPSRGSSGLAPERALEGAGVAI